ncbi:MAG: preprotein translocase subunit SecY, partial [Clostridia bacterium]|nr:preprotein translocase subunit SecY [Clostridia bacterium]
MWETIKNAWKIPEIRKKIIFTLFIILVFRVGSVIPVPFVNPEMIREMSTGQSANQFFNYLSILTGGGLTYGAIFAMSVTPYINASIIIQLLTVVIKPWERLSQQGEEGRKKLAQITRFATVILGLIQGTAYFFYLNNNKCLSVTGGAVVFAAFVIILTLTAGSALVMWLGEQIDVKGIGNGISILLFAGIISRGPDALDYLIGIWDISTGYKVAAIAIVLAFIAVIVFIVWMTGAERRIPIQYAKRVVGNRQYGGQNTHLPIKVNMSGVLPVIFASSFLMVPTILLSFEFLVTEGSSFYKFLSLFSVQGA